MIQDIYPDIFINHYEHFSPDPKDSVIYFQDGGLLVPNEIPKVDAEFIDSLQNISYQERAVKVLGLFP